jgi:ribokinase
MTSGTRSRPAAGKGRAGRVVVVGQLARDLVLRVEQIPGRGEAAPVSERLEMLGGKGANQAVGMSQLGLSATLIAAVGDDETAGYLLAQAAADGIDTSWVARRTRTPTGVIVSVVDHGGWRYLEYLPPETLVGPEDIEHAEPAFRAAGIVVIQLQQPPQAALAAARLGRRCGCLVVLDGAPAKAAYREPLLASADVVRADTREAALLTGQPVDSDAEAVQAGQELLCRGPSLVALAAGHDGNAIIWPGGSLVVPLGSAPARDTTGAGDAFVAALTASLARGLGPADSGRNAAAAAAQTVTHLGGRPRLEPALLGR